MKKLFKFVIDTDKGVVYNKDGTIKGSKTEKGYYTCRIKDCYGNIYHSIHEVIYAEGAQFPKHLWPVDEKGKRYEVDHILPVKNGGTDVFENLRLVSIHDNHNNELTLQNYSNATKGEKILCMELIGQKKEKKTHKGFKWMYKEDYEKNITKSPTTFIE